MGLFQAGDLIFHNHNEEDSACPQNEKGFCKRVALHRMRSRIMRCYRETLKRAQYLGGERGHGVLLDARQAFNALRRLSQPAELDAGIASVESRLSYLRMITPRYAGGVSSIDSSDRPAEPRGAFVVRNGKLETLNSSPSSSHKVLSTFTGSNVDPEALRRHQRLIERQHFRGDYWARRGQAQPPSSPLGR